MPALQPGQVVTAAVESVQGRETVLRLMGILLRARAEVPLFPGEVLELLVASAGPDHLHLRRLDPAVAGAADPPGGGAAGTAAGSGALENLAARALAAYRQPLDPSAVDRLARLIAVMPEAQRELAASAGTWLLSIGDAPAPAALRDLAAAAAGPRPFSLRQRLLALAEAMESAADQANNGSLAARLRATAAELRAWGWHGARPGAAGQGGRAAAGSGTPQAAGSSPGPGSTGTSAPGAADEPAAAPTGATASGAGAGRHPSSAGPRPATPPAPAPGQEAATAGRAGPGLRHLAEVLSDAARTLEPLPPEAREAAQAALRDANGLLSSLRRLSGAPSGGGDAAWAVYPLPFTQGSLDGEALLLRRRRGGRSGTAGDEPDDLYLYVSTPHLGPLAVHLVWHRGAVGATLTAASPEAAGALAAALPRLAGALTEQGLQVSSLRTAIGATDPPPVFRPPDPAPPRGLDRRL